MDAPQQTIVFDQIAAKAKRAGLLKYNKHGLMILTLPDHLKQPAPVAAASATTAPVAGS